MNKYLTESAKITEAYGKIGRQISEGYDKSSDTYVWSDDELADNAIKLGLPDQYAVVWLENGRAIAVFNFLEDAEDFKHVFDHTHTERKGPTRIISLTGKASARNESVERKNEGISDIMDADEIMDMDGISDEEKLKMLYDMIDALEEKCNDELERFNPSEVPYDSYDSMEDLNSARNSISNYYDYLADKAQYAIASLERKLGKTTIGGIRSRAEFARPNEIDNTDEPDDSIVG